MESMTAQDQLFATVPAAPRPSSSSGEVAVDKTFRVYDQDQSFLMPPSLRDWLPDDHLALFVSELVEEVLDLSPFLASYTEARGFPPYHPRLMLKVLLYGYTTGVRSSRKIETRCHEDVAFRYLAANSAPDFRSIARFRARHLPALESLFMQALTLCQQVGMVKMGRVALDGTKVKANASRHKAMSYDWMCRAQENLEAEVKAMMAEAEGVDAEEDARHGPGNRGGDLQGEMARRESRLAKIRKAKDDLEQHARQQAADTARAKAQDAGADAEVAERDAARAAESARVKPKAQRNFTDSDARIADRGSRIGATSPCAQALATGAGFYHWKVTAGLVAASVLVRRVRRGVRGRGGGLIHQWSAQQGVGSAMNDLARELGGALGIAVLGSVLQSTYRSHLHPTGLPEAVAERARSSLALASRVDPTTAHQAQAAFTDGMQSALIFAAVAVGIAALTVAGLLHRPHPTEPAAESDAPAATCVQS